MPHPIYTVLHKSEWDRLKKQGEGSDEKSNEGPLTEKYEYLKILTEQSQEWVKNWSHTAAGHVQELEKEKRRQEKKNMTFIRKFAKMAKKGDCTEAIKNAKQTIFDRSSYGKKLIGALVESKVLKEVDAQIEFNKKLKLEAEQARKEIESKEMDLINFNKETERIKINRTKLMECNRYNQEMIAIKKENQQKIIEKEKQCAIEGDKIMEELINKEKKAKEEHKRAIQKGIIEFEAEKREIAKLKAHSEKLDDDLIKAHKQVQEKMKLKMEQVHKKVHLGRTETKRYRDAYTMMENIQRDKNKKFEDFLDSAIKLWEKRTAKKELKEIELDREKRLHRRAIAEENKRRGEEDKHKDVSCANKCTCDRQTILPKIKRKALKMKVAWKDLCDEKKCPPTAVKKPSFLEPREELVKQLRVREKEPSPWNGARGAHEMFTRNAAAVLKECGHKHLVHKVIEEYRRFNGLDETTLPIP